MISRPHLELLMNLGEAKRNRLDFVMLSHEVIESVFLGRLNEGNTVRKYRLSDEEEAC